MVGASAIQGTLQGTSTPTYTGVLDRARTTVGTATSAQAGGGAAAATGASVDGSGLAAQAGPNLASGAPSGASVNGQRIPLCSHGGPCQGATLRGWGNSLDPGGLQPPPGGFKRGLDPATLIGARHHHPAQRVHPGLHRSGRHPLLLPGVLVPPGGIEAPPAEGRHHAPGHRQPSLNPPF